MRTGEGEGAVTCTYVATTTASSTAAVTTTFVDTFEKPVLGEGVKGKGEGRGGYLRFHVGKGSVLVYVGRGVEKEVEDTCL